MATIKSADGRFVETRHVPIDTSSLSLSGGLSNTAKQALLQSLEGPAYHPYAQGVVNVVLRDGTTAYQDVAKYTNVSTTNVPQYTTDSRVNAVFAKFGVTQVTRIARSISRSQLVMMHSRAMATDRSILNLANAFQVRVTTGTVPQLVRELLKQPTVAYASPDWTVSTTNVSMHPIPSTVQMPQAHSLGLMTQSMRSKSDFSLSATPSKVPTNYGVRTSLESWLNAPGVDAVAAYDEIAKQFGQLPGQGEIVTNVSIGDICANPPSNNSNDAVTSHVISGQHYLDVPSMPLIPEYAADSDANLSGQTEVCGVDSSDGEILMDFNVMAPLPAGQQRGGATGSSTTDMLGVAPGAQYRLVVPQSDFSASGLVAAFLAAAAQTPNPNVITASLGWGLDSVGFPSRYLEEDPLMRSVISSIVNSDNIVVCISGGDGLRTYTNAAVNMMGGSVPTNLVATLDQQTNLNDVSYSTVPSSVVDTGAIDVGGSTTDDILSANPLDPQFAKYANQLAFPETRWNGFRSFSSGFGSRVNVSAPSDNIPTMSFQSGNKNYNSVVVGLEGGTSASAPMTAAAAAVMLQVARLTGHPFAKATDVRAHLISTAMPVPNVPQADMQINVGPQINVRRGVEKLMANAGMMLTPSLGRVAIAQRRMFNGASACRNSGNTFQYPEEDQFVEATDPTYIVLNDVDNCWQPAARNLKSPITIAPDWEGMPVNASYKLYVAGHSGQVLATTPYARLYPQQIFQAAGLLAVSPTARTISLTYEVDAGFHMVASKTFDLTFSPSPAFSLTLDAPLVAPVIDSTQMHACAAAAGQCFTVSYDFSNLPANYLNSPQIEISLPGRTVDNGYYQSIWTSGPLAQPKGTVDVPISQLPGGGIYGVMLNRWTDPVAAAQFFNVSAYSQTAITRLAIGSSVRAGAPLVSLPTDAANGIAPSHGIGLPASGGSFIVSWDMSNVPGATNGTLEFSAPGPNFVGNYNPFNNPNGSTIDNDGLDTGSTAHIALPSVKGTMTVTAAQANLVPGMGQVVRVIPQAGANAVGEASDVSYVTEPGIFPIAPLSLIHGFAINPNGDDGVFTVSGLIDSNTDSGSIIGTFSQTNKPKMTTINAETYVGDPYKLFGYIGGNRMAFQQGAVSQEDSQAGGGHDAMRQAAWQATAVTPGSSSGWANLKTYFPPSILPPGYSIVEAGRNMSTTPGPVPVLAQYYNAASFNTPYSYGLFFLDGTAAAPTVSASTWIPLTTPASLGSGWALSNAIVDYDPAASTAYILATASQCSFFGGCSYMDFLVTVVNPAVNSTATPTWTQIGNLGSVVDFEYDPTNKVGAFTTDDANGYPTSLNIVNVSGATPTLNTISVPMSNYYQAASALKVAIDPANQLIAVLDPTPAADDIDNNPLSQVDLYNYAGQRVESTPRNYDFSSWTLGDHWFQLNPGTRTMFTTTSSFDDIIPIKY